MTRSTGDGRSAGPPKRSFTYAEYTLATGDPAGVRTHPPGNPTHMRFLEVPAPRPDPLPGPTVPDPGPPDPSPEPTPLPPDQDPPQI